MRFIACVDGGVGLVYWGIEVDVLGPCLFGIAARRLGIVNARPIHMIMATVMREYRKAAGRLSQSNLSTHVTD